MLCYVMFYHSSPDGAGKSQANQSDQPLAILRPPSSGAAAAGANILCPFCLVNFSPGQRPLEEQLVDHLLNSCRVKNGQ